MITPASARSKIPLPRIENRLLGWAVFILGIIILFDSYDGSGRSKSWAASAILPF